METTFQILEVVLAVYKKHGYNTRLGPLADGLNCAVNTKGTYLLKSNNGTIFYELHTPFGNIRLFGHNGFDTTLAETIQYDLVTHLKGRFLTPNNSYYLITHVRNKPIQYPIVRTTVAKIEEIYDYLYVPQHECMNWNMTRAFYDSEIQRLVEAGWLTDDLSALRDVQENASLVNYERLICMLCDLNTQEDCMVVEFRKTIKPEKYIHILGLIILSGTMIHTH
jgi:hypothetical protein